MQLDSPNLLPKNKRGCRKKARKKVFTCYTFVNLVNSRKKILTLKGRDQKKTRENILAAWIN